MKPRSYRLTSASTAARVSHGGFGSRPAKNMLYCASRFFSPLSSFCRSRSTSEMCGDCGGVLATVSGGGEKADERNPQLARVRHFLAVHENLGVSAGAHDVEDIKETARLVDVKLGVI